MGCLNAEDYLSGKCFQQPAVSSPPVLRMLSRQPSKQTGVYYLNTFQTTKPAVLSEELLSKVRRR